MARPNLLELLRSQQSVEKPNAEAPVVEKTNPLIELIKKQKESEPFEGDSFGNIQQIEKEKPLEINKVIDDFPSYKGIKEIASLVGNATPSPSLNDDEKVTLKKIYSRPDLTNEQKAKAFATMANEHYYFDDKTGLPVAVKHGEEIPVGKNIESVWGDDVSANEHSGLFATPINAAKNLAAFAPNFVKSAAGLIHLPFALATGETADWYKEIKQQTEALKMKTSQDSQTPILNTEGIENFSDFFDPKRWTVNPMNIVGVGSQAMSSIAQFILGGEVIKAFGVGSKAISKLGGIAGESEMTLGELGKSLGSDVLGAIGMRAKTKLPYLLAGIGVNMGEGEDYAKEAGIEGRERYAVGAIYGIAASAIETEMGFTGKIAKGKLKLMKDAIGKDLIKGWAKDAEGNITKESLKDLFEKSSVANVGFWNTVKGMGKETAKTMLGEGTEEVSQNFSKRLIGEAADKIEGRNDFKKRVATPEAVGDYINDFIGGALAAMGGTVITPRRSFSRQKYEEQSSQAFNAIANGKVDELNATLSSAEKKGLITPEQRKLADQKIAGYQNYYNQIKSLKIDDKQKKRVSDLVWTNENLKALIQEEKKKPEDLQLKLKTYEGLLSKGQKEIQTILNPAITNEMITVPEGADEQIDLFEQEKPSENKPNTTVKPKAPTVKQEKKEVVPASIEEKYDIDAIEKLASKNAIEEYLLMEFNGVEIPESVNNAAHNRIVELTQAKEEEVAPAKKKAEPDEAAKKKFAEHLEALNKLDDNFDNEKNFDAFELRKKLIKETSEKSRVPVPTEITEAIKAKEESSKKRSIKNEISGIVTQSEKELDDEKTKLEALKKKGIKKNELSFDKIDLADEGDFIKKQTDEDSSFKSFFDKHKSFENEDTKSPSNGQKAALESLGSTGILSEEEASHEGSTMAEASSAIHEAVKRIQYLKVNAESDAKAKELKQYQSDIMKMMSLPGIVETAEKHHEKIKNFADVNEKNAKEKHDAISKEQTRLAKKVVEEEKDFKKDKLRKKILQLSTLKTKIEKLHPEAFVKKEETKSAPLTNEVSKTEPVDNAKETATEKEQKIEENKQQEQESEKKEEPIDHTANLQSVIKEIDNNKGKPIKGTLTALEDKFNGKVGVEVKINGEKQVVHIASSSTKVEQNANQKSKGKALQGQFGIVPKALVESNAPVTLHLIKVGEVDASGKAWNVNGELKNKYGTPYGDKVEVWSGDKYIGVLQETVHPKEEAKLAKPKTDFEKLQQRMDEFSEKMEQNRLNKNPHKKASAAYFKFEQARQLEKDKLQKEYADVTGKKQGIGISDAQIKAFVYGVLAEVAKVVDKLKRKDAVEKGYKDLRKYLNANKEEITVEQAMAAESTFEKELEQPKKQTEEVEDTAGVNSQNMSAQARYFQNKEKIRSFYTGIRDFENDTQIEKLLNEVMLDKTFNKGKPFEEDIEGSIKELYRQGREELSDKKLSLAKRLESLLNSKQKEGERWSGREKVSQISMFFRNTHNQPYIAMNIASKGTADLIFVNGAYEKTLKDRALHALTKITDKQFEQKIADFKKTKKTMADQFALLKDLTGLEEKYWQRFLLAPKIKGDEISKLPYFVIGNGTTAKQTSVFEGKTKRDFINNLVNKKGSVVNTITLATPAHEQLSVIKPIFKDSEWNSRTSSSFSTHLISALNNVNNSVYANSPFYKNNNFVKQYIGKAKGAVIFMTSGASNIFKNKKFNAENMTDNDILKMMYAAYTQDIKDAPKEEDGTYLQCLGQFGDKGFLSWTKCQKYTNLAEAKKHFADINKRNGLDAEAQEKMLIEEAKENTKQLFSSPTELQEKQAELFTFNYAINYAEVNEVVNGGLLQYGEGQQGITALFKRNGSTASPGEAGSKYEKGGLGESHGIVLINAPKIPLLDKDGKHIEKWNDKLKKMVKQFFSFGDGQEYITREHSDKAKISTGGKYHSIIKAITSFTNPNGTRVLVKSGAIVIDELVKKFPDNEAYKAILKTMKDAGVGRIVTVDAAKLRKDTEIYNLFKEDSHELNPDAGEVSDKHIITVKTDDYLFQQDLVNDGKLKQSTTPIQRIKNMMGSKTAKAIQSQYNEIAKKKLDAFSERISKIYGELDEKQKREAFTKFLLTNGKTTSEEAQSLLDEFDAEGMTGDDLDFINTLLVARVDNSHPILHSWAQRFIGNTIEKEALGRIANKVQLVEFAYIPGKGFELRDYRKTADGKTLLPEIAVPKSTGLRLPKTFKTKEAAIAAIINEKAKYRDMYDGEGLTEDSYGNVLEHEIEKTDKGWVVPGEYAMVTRIPADGMHSTTLARVKYHTPKEMGNVIITSVGMQKLAGSDFDGDTRFVEGFFKSPEGHILKDKETKQPLLNKKGHPKLDRVASNKATPKGMANKAFHTDAQYFYDTNNFDEITNGINDKAFDHILEKLPKEKEYAAFGPKTFLNARTKNTTGLRVVGIAARYIGAYDYLKKHNAFVGKVDEKGKPVPYYFPLAKINNAPTTKKLISKFASGWQMKKVMGNLLNLALDNVKNPKIERLGLNEVTVPMFYTSLMLKPQEISVEDWTEHVIAFYTQPAVKKFVKLVRDANSVFNEDKSQDIIGKVNRKVRNEEGNWEEDNSVFTPEENKVLAHLKTQYFISQDINKLSTVIDATEKGIKSWAEYKNVKYIINDINNNKLQNINTEKFVGSSFIQAAVESADAMKSFLAKDAYEETKFAKDILKTAEAEFDKVQKGKKKEGRFSLKQFEAFSKAVSDSMIALTRNLKTPWKDQRGDFVQSIIQSKKDLPGKIQKQIDLFNGLTAQYRTLDSTIKRLEDFGDKLNQLPSKKEEQEELKPKILAEKEKLDDLKAKNTIVQMLDNKSRNTAEFVDSDGQKIVKGDTYNSLGLRIDLQKQEMEADEKKVVYDAMDRLSKSDPKFVTDFTNLVIFDTHMSTSSESGGLAQLLSPKIHEQIGSDMRKEKEKWDNDSYSKLEKAKIVDKIFENNPELLDKKYEKKLGESAIEKDYSAFAEGVLPVTFVKQETFDKVSDGSKNTITLSLGKNTMNHDTANKVKAGYQLNMSFEGKEIQREVAKVVKSENSVDITFKPLVKEKISNTDNIYFQLGDKTQSKNVILPKDVDYEADGKGMEYTSAIDFWRKVVPEAMALFNKRQPLIVAFRGNSKKTFLQNYNSGSHTIGNPFNWQDEKGNRKEQGVISTKKFIKWMITGDNQGNNNATEEYRQAIIKDIKSGKLKGSSILYYEEKHYATHATALDYLINKYEWNKEQSSSQEQWNTYKDELTKRHPDITEEEWNSMSDMERKKAIECL